MFGGELDPAWVESLTLDRIDYYHTRLVDYRRRQREAIKQE